MTNEPRGEMKVTNFQAQAFAHLTSEQWTKAMEDYNRVALERDALAVQNDAARKVLLKISELEKPRVGGTGSSSNVVYCIAQEALKLDAPRAARIAEARRKVVEAAGRWDYHENCDQDCDYEAGVKLHDALAELRKAESGNS